MADTHIYIYNLHITKDQLLEHNSAAALEQSRRKAKQKKKVASSGENNTKEGPAASDPGESKAPDSQKVGNEEMSSPATQRVCQRVVHVFNLISSTESEQGTFSEPKLVRVQELAIDWKGDSFQNNDPTKDVTGLYVWSAAVVLSRWIVDIAASFEGKSVFVRIF